MDRYPVAPAKGVAAPPATLSRSPVRTFAVGQPADGSEESSVSSSDDLMTVVQEQSVPVTILIVEDCKPVRDVTARILRSGGYVVIEVCRGQEAKDEMSRRSSEIRLVLADLGLPDICGADLLRELRRERDGLKALLMSGHPGDLEEYASRNPCVPCIAKPFLPLALLALVDRVLRQEAD